MTQEEGEDPRGVGFEPEVRGDLVGLYTIRPKIRSHRGGI